MNSGTIGDKNVRARILWAVGFVLVVLTAGGCGAIGTTDDRATQPTSPLAEFLGVDTNGPGDDQFKEQERKANELAVACMTAQGFEYIPESESIDIPDAYSDDELPPESREWAEKYGYGISTIFADQFSGAGEGHQDPNQEYLDGLSEAEVEAFEPVVHDSASQFFNHTVSQVTHSECSLHDAGRPSIDVST